MLHKQKGCTSPMLHIFTLLNLNNEKFFHIFAITSQNKIVNNIIRLNHSSPMKHTLQEKIKPFTIICQMLKNILKMKITLLPLLIHHYRQTR